MPTANYDASLLTQRKRNIALYTYYLDNQNAVNAGTTVRREQPNTQLGTVVTERRQTAGNTNPAPVPCACTESVDRNAGGDNSNNVQ